MSFDVRRVRAVLRKDLQEYRRNPNIVYTTAILPLIFLIQPLVQVFALPSSSSDALHHEHTLLYMLAIPVLVPAVLSAYSLVGERLQGTLEPLLATPIRSEELLTGKALAAFAPSVAIAYAVFALFVALVELFARPGVASALIQGPDLVAQLVFTPLLAAWSIWIGIAVSARSTDPRTATQVSLLLSLPTVAVTTLVAFNIIPDTPIVATVLGVALVVLVSLGWRVVSAMFNRERLVAGAA